MKDKIYTETRAQLQGAKDYMYTGDEGLPACTTIIGWSSGGRWWQGSARERRAWGEIEKKTWRKERRRRKRVEGKFSDGVLIVGGNCCMMVDAHYLYYYPGQQIHDLLSRGFGADSRDFSLMLFLFHFSIC